MRRVLSIWLPNLAIERWASTADCPPDSPVVLTVEGTHGPVIHAVTRAAAERGARCFVYDFEGSLALHSPFEESRKCRFLPAVFIGVLLPNLGVSGYGVEGGKITFLQGE